MSMYSLTPTNKTQQVSLWHISVYIIGRVIPPVNGRALFWPPGAPKTPELIEQKFGTIHHISHTTSNATIDSLSIRGIDWARGEIATSRSFLLRCMECRRGLAMRILSVRLSNACIVTKRKKICPDFIPCERSFSLVF